MSESNTRIVHLSVYTNADGVTTWQLNRGAGPISSPEAGSNARTFDAARQFGHDPDALPVWDGDNAQWFDNIGERVDDVDGSDLFGEFDAPRICESCQHAIAADFNSETFGVDSNLCEGCAADAADATRAGIAHAHERGLDLFDQFDAYAA